MEDTYVRILGIMLNSDQIFYQIYIVLGPLIKISAQLLTNLWYPHMYITSYEYYFALFN